MALTDNFVIPPGTALRDFRKEIDTDREAANLAGNLYRLKTDLQKSINRTAIQTNAATVAGATAANRRTNLLPVSADRSPNTLQGQENLKILERALEKSKNLAARTGQAYAGTVESFGKSGNVPVAIGAQTPEALATGKYVEGKTTEEIANLALKQVTDTTQQDIDQGYRIVDGKKVPFGFSKEKTKTIRKTQQKVPTAQEIVSGTKQIGRGQARFQQPSAPATPTGAATPEEGQKLALQQLAASQQFRASGANPRNMKYLGDEPAGKGKIRHKWVDITTKQPFSLTVRSGP
jgi:hypothetical protein